MSNNEKIQVRINHSQLNRELEGDFFAGITLTSEGDENHTQYCMGGALGFEDTFLAAKALQQMSDQLLGMLPIPKSIAEDLMKCTKPDSDRKDSDKASNDSSGNVKVFSLTGDNLPEELAKLFKLLLKHGLSDDKQ